MWAFHGERDAAVSFQNSVSIVEAVNATRPRVRAKLTLYPELGHDCWNATYQGPGLAATDPDYDPYVMNIYDWLFQYEKPVD